MSHYFPMVSSSPPPFDDSNHSFEDDNEETDDFGDFSSHNNFDFPQQLPLKDAGVVRIDESIIENEINQKINEEDVKQISVSNGGEEEFPEFIRPEQSFISPAVLKVEDAVVEEPTVNVIEISLNSFVSPEVLKVEDAVVEEPSINAIENSLDSFVSPEVLKVEEPTLTVKDSLDSTGEQDCKDNNTDVTEISGVKDDFQLEEEEKEVVSSNNVEEDIAPSSEIEAPGFEISHVENDIDDSNFPNGGSAVDNLKECSEVNSIYEEDDDDFADFQRDGEKLENDFDDFKDFETGGNFNEELESEKFEANFAAFEDANFTPLQSFPNNLDATVNESDDEFGHFEFTTPYQIPSFEQLIFTTLCAVFVKCDVISDENEKLPSQIIQLEDALKQKCSKASCDCVWEKVKDIDNTQALTYHWSTSHSNKRLLHSLHLNSQNFLPGAKWASSIPLFAANLGSDPLEPTKAPMKITEDNISISEISHQTTTTLDTVVPPVQFDWGSSGLINPLDDSSSALLDLDFFITNDYVISKSSTTKTINSLETEFLGNEGSATKTFYSERKPAVSPLVDKILSEATIKSNGGKYKQNISKEAKRILTSLQDLSFMQARVLMFPIRDGAGYE